MADLTPVSPAIGGSTFAASNASGGGDKFPNPRGTVLFYVKNGGGGSIDVTLTAQTTTRPAAGKFPAMTVSNKVITVAAGAEKLIGPIPTAYNDSAGKVNATYSGTTTVTVKAIQP